MRLARGDVLFCGGQPTLDALNHAGLIAQAFDAGCTLLSRFTRGTRGAKLLLQGNDLIADLVRASLCILGEGSGVARERCDRRRHPTFGLLVTVGLAGNCLPRAASLGGQFLGVLLARGEACAQQRQHRLDLLRVQSLAGHAFSDGFVAGLDAEQAEQEGAALGVGQP